MKFQHPHSRGLKFFFTILSYFIFKLLNFLNDLSHFLFKFSAGIFQIEPGKPHQLKVSLAFYSFQKYEQKLPFCHTFSLPEKIKKEDFNRHQFFSTNKQYIKVKLMQNEKNL